MFSDGQSLHRTGRIVVVASSYVFVPPKEIVPEESFLLAQRYQST